MQRTLKKVFNVSDLRALARKRLPAPLFNYIDGGADDETNVLGNVHAYDNARLIPEYLVDVKEVDTTTRVLGRDISMPLFLAPTGMTRLFHHDG
jgi:L-lactate dehydrogenase (cytochrome)